MNADFLDKLAHIYEYVSETGDFLGVESDIKRLLY